MLDKTDLLVSVNKYESEIRIIENIFNLLDNLSYIVNFVLELVVLLLKFFCLPDKDIVKIIKELQSVNSLDFLEFSIKLILDSDCQGVK